METQFVTYPLQKLSLSQKDEEWRQSNVEFFINKSMIGMYSGSQNLTRYEKIARNYNVYNGKINRKDFEYVTNPFNIDSEDAMPANLKNINIVRTAIDLLIGEETKRPFNMYTFQTNPNVLSEEIQQHDDELRSIVEQMIMSKLLQKYGPQIQGMDQQQVQQEQDALMQKALENHMGHTFKDEMEEAVNHYCNWAIYKYDLKDLFINCWKDGLISAFEVAYLGKMNNRAYPERVNPLYFDCDKNPDLYFIQQGNWAVRKMFMDPTSVIDRFGDMLKPEDKDSIMEGYPFSSARNSGSDVNYNYIRRSYDNFDPNQSLLSNQIPVWHTTWRSYVKIGYLRYTDPMTGQIVEDVVSEDYKKREGDELTWDWVTQVWEGWRIGSTVFCGIEPTDFDDLPYVGIIHNNDNSEMVSLIDIMFPLLVTYIITWYRLELTMARDKGKVINIDVTQIPKSLGFDFKLWAHYLTMLQVNLINPYEEGWDIKRQGAASFNQFSSVDLTMANVINEYVLLLNKIEDMIGDISGVTKQRKGSITNYELVSNVERSVTQSSHITEPWFYRHNRFKEMLMKELVKFEQRLWPGEEEVLSYIMDDMTKIVWKMPKNFDMADVDIFISDGTAEARKLEAIRSLAQPALQSGATLYEAANMQVTNNATEILRKLKEIDDRRAENAAQASKAEQQAEAQANAMIEQSKEKDRSLEQEKSIRQAKTAITVAMINHGSGDMPEEDEITKIQQEELNLKKDKIEKDNKQKEKVADETIRHNKEKEKIDKQKKNAIR